ncbi:hypothetical protein GP486_003403 [Trichoglossum hirsutum]|uniref:Uncharacterized protein n=1 Tax=Trichoglossum hirsutum TaxID=265104 RepID=A0A9P8RQQ0_9PEZI|nr:hypothetical protein GP486_003403 [Trichoglossum hirsutum]
MTPNTRPVTTNPSEETEYPIRDALTRAVQNHSKTQGYAVTIKHSCNRDKQQQQQWESQEQEQQEQEQLGQGQQKQKKKKREQQNKHQG